MTATDPAPHRETARVPPSPQRPRTRGKNEATLHKRDGTYYLHVAVEKEVEAPSGDEQTENGVVLGVDLNVDGYLAVTTRERSSATQAASTTDATNTYVGVEISDRLELAPHISPPKVSVIGSLGGVPTTCIASRRLSCKQL